MRQLSKRQKKMINTWISENWAGVGSIEGAGDIPSDLYEKIERLNPHETFWQNANRYIMDKVMNKVHC